jgi:geranylgeranylglycerol-phosphate geranylgeranyltransferase
VQSIHFHQKVTANGEKISKSRQDASEELIYMSAKSRTKSKITCNKLQPNITDNNNILAEYLRTFVYYVKARSNVYVFAFATLISLLLGSHLSALDYSIAIRVVSASYFMALATYIYNDITDFELDKINQTNRPSVTGKATKRQLIRLVFVLNGIALLFTSSVSLYALYISVLFIALGIAYSHPKLNLKDKFPLKTVVTAAGAGLLSLLGGIAALTTTIDSDYNNNFSSFLPIIYAALFFFAFFFILGPLGDIGDLKGDRLVGRRTFPIVLGIRSTIVFMLSIPLTIILMAVLLAYCSYHDNLSIASSSSSGTIFINLPGIYLIIGTSISTLVFILRISKKANANDALAIKSVRPKMRFLHIMLQISLLLTFM